MRGVGLGGAGEGGLADRGKAVALEAATGFAEERRFDGTRMNSGV